MAYLVLGLVLFLGMHSVSIVAPVWRDRTAARLGNAWRGLYSLVSIAGLVLIIWGYGIARQSPVMLYMPPAGTQYVTAVLMLPVFPLFLAAYFPGRIKRTLSIRCSSASCSGHWHISSRRARWPTSCYSVDSLRGRLQTASPTDGVRSGRSPAPTGRLNDAIAIVAGLVIYVVFEHWLHTRWIGVQPLPM